jgi:DNA transposition AAA+ family ATPase
MKLKKAVAEKTATPAVRQRLLGFQTSDATRMTLARLAGLCGTNSGAICKYLDGHPVGNVALLESKITAALDTYATLTVAEHTICESIMTRDVADGIGMIVRMRDIGLIDGPAGIGKSVGIGLYCAANPLALSISLTQGTGSARGVQDHVFSLLGAHGDYVGGSRQIFIFERLAGTGRPLIIDNAQRIRPSGIRYLMDLWDRTHIPIAAVGNPEFLALVKTCDQHYSRSGYHVSVVADPDSCRAVAQRMSREIIGDAATDAVTPLLSKVATHEGYLRASFKHLQITRQWLATPVYAGKPDLAFRDAHDSLICASTYSL